MTGTVAPPALLRAVRDGHVGAVILFAGNLVSRGQALALTGTLQRAAVAGDNPRLLIATDQEGGEVKRILSGPPTVAPPRMSAAVAAHQGLLTGRFLRSWGINMDLAPVSDVPTSSASFIARQGRAFSTDAQTVARGATAFALGLQADGVAATAKHFPGLGSAATDTDLRRQELSPTVAQRDAALLPYRRMVPRGVDAVMLSVAGFPAYDASGAAAALSPAIIERLLRARLHFTGVTITDSLAAPTGHSEQSAGVLAAAAGADLLLFSDSAPGELSALESALARGTIARAAAAASYRRVVALKRKLGLD
jgi:beta-N-acetylhexosaminidase